MRTGRRRADGTTALSTIDKSLTDLQRYLRFQAGESVLEISKAEQMEQKVIESSIRRGRGMFEGEQQIRLRDAKYEGAIQNEKIRNDVRKRVADKLVTAHETLLDGIRTIVETDKITGKVTLHEIVDPDIIALGVEAALKTLSLAERPMPAQTIVNVQQNNADGPSSRSGELTYEEQIERIQNSQMRQIGPAADEDDDIPASRQIIEAEVTDVTDKEEPLF